MAPLQMVLVCTGNRARSPLLEHFLRGPLTGLSVDVSSVGTKDVGRRGALPEAIEAGAELGVDLSDHLARPIGWRSLTGADLVIGFEASHVELAVRDGGADPARTFRLVELVDILEQVDLPVQRGSVEAARAAIALADAQRHLAGGDLEIPDPLGRPLEFHRSVAVQLAGLGRRLALALFGPPPLPPPASVTSDP